MVRAARLVPAAGLSLASVALTLLALEIAARFLADPTGGHRDLLALREEARRSSVHVAADDPELVYVTRPGYVTNGVRISEAHGIVRSDDVTVEKPAGVFRVAVLGDSIAAAHPVRVRPAPSFSEEMERTLNTRGAGARYQVVNFGTDGYGTVQEARLLETRVGAFAPDVVLVQYCLNDPTLSYTPALWFVEGREPRSYLLDLVRRRLGFTPSELHPAHPRYTHGTIDWTRLYAADGIGWANVLRGLARIEAWAAPRRVPVALAFFPLLVDARDTSQREVLTAVYSRVREAARARGFHVIDLGPAFAQHPVETLRLLPEDPIHPGPFGHALAAQEIVAGLDAAGLLPPPQ